MSAPSRESYAAHIQATAPEHADWLIPLLRPAIGISSIPAPANSIPIGASKFGGAPDLPAGVPWPSENGIPFHLIAQINLAEIAPFDLENRLPDHGLLSFFCYEGVWPEGSIPLVFWYPQGNLVRAQAPSGYVMDPPDNSRPASFLEKLKRFASSFSGSHMAPPLPSQRLEFVLEWQLPNWNDPEITIPLEKLSSRAPRPPLPHPAEPGQVPKPDPAGELDDEIWAPQSESEGHQLLGYDHPIQNCARVDAVANQDYDRATYEALEWDLLFQQDSDDGWLWGDVGAIYYFIRREDLLARRFDRVSLVHQSC
jgi:hypothetical protein